MEALFIVGTVLLIIAIIVTIGTAMYAHRSLQSAKAEDFLEKYYDEEYGDEP